MVLQFSYVFQKKTVLIQYLFSYYYYILWFKLVLIFEVKLLQTKRKTNKPFKFSVFVDIKIVVLISCQLQNL